MGVGGRGGGERGETVSTGKGDVLNDAEIFAIRLNPSPATSPLLWLNHGGYFKAANAEPPLLEKRVSGAAAALALPFDCARTYRWAPTRLHYLCAECSHRAVSELAQQRKRAGRLRQVTVRLGGARPAHARLPRCCFHICSFIIKCLRISEGYVSARIASFASVFFSLPLFFFPSPPRL